VDEAKMKLFSTITAPIYTAKAILVISGFTKGHSAVIRTSSGRTTELQTISPPTLKDHEQFDPLISMIAAKYKGRQRLPHAALEVLKCNVGLLGFWYENIAMLPRHLDDINVPMIDNASFVIEDDIKKKSKTGTTPFLQRYWEHVVNAATKSHSHNMNNFKDMAENGMLLYTTTDFTGFLNPLFIFHKKCQTVIPPLLSLSPTPMNVFHNVMTAYEATLWDVNAKGEALEALVTAILRIRQCYYNWDTANKYTERLFNVLCGKLIKVTCSNGTYEDTSADDYANLTSLTDVSIPKGHVDVDAFPAVFCTPLTKAQRSMNKVQLTGTDYADHKKQVERRDEIRKAFRNQEGDNDVGLITMRSVYNPGCDIAFVVKGKTPQGKTPGQDYNVLLLYECYHAEYKQENTRISEEGLPQRKARITLKALNELLSSGQVTSNVVLARGRIHHVCYVYCRTCESPEIKYDMAFEDLGKYVKDLKQYHEVVTTFHAITDPTEWEEFLTSTLYFAAPSIGEKLSQSCIPTTPSQK
jgi:hypothetical protein